ncbi:MAG: immunoglobulin domain-containing protein [Verrucomicrobia bacterium]|nr:immunoglobulin domain-containing protein [Verrucomicrobiota bacterium]
MNSDCSKTRRATSPIVCAALILCGLCGATVAPGQVQKYEGFDYTGTALHGQNGGTGWAGNAWSDSDADTPLSNDGVSLTFPASVNHSPAGSRVVFTGPGEAERRLGASINLGAGGATYYVSALVKRQGSFKFEFIDNGTNVRWRFGALGGGSTNTALVGVSSDVLFNDVFPVDETVLVVAKMATLAASSPGDSVFMNVYRAGDTVPMAEPTTWQANATQNSGVTLVRLQIRNIDALPLEIDEIRVGTTWLEVASGPVTGPPLITRQPVSATVYQGGFAQFSAEAAGDEPLSYQWKRAGIPLPNATNNVLTLLNVQPAQAGFYTVTVTNTAGSATSDPTVQLQVIAVTNTTVGLVAQWPFDETTGLTAADATANGNHGTLVNFAGDDSQWVAGESNGALQFGGSNYVEVPHSASLGANLANGFSVATWIRSAVPLTASANTYRMLEKENSFFLLQGDGNTNNLGVGGVAVLVKKGGANLAVGVGEALAADRWYHVAATYDGVNVRIYLDGDLKGMRAVAAPIDTPSQPLHLGADYMASGSGQKYLNGAMDEVGIWERALQAVEVATMAGYVGVPYVVSPPEPQSKYEGATAVFQVAAKGEQPLRYLWFKGAQEIRSATSNTLVLFNVQTADAGDYRCRISNNLGDTFTDWATLTVIPVTAMSDGQAALWKFEDGIGLIAGDDSGNGLDGQLVDYAGEDEQWIPGQVGGALTFDGQSNRVVVANGASVALGSDATIAFWMYPLSYGTLVDHANYFSHNSRVLHKGGHVSVELVDDPGSVRATLRVNGVSAPQNVVDLNVWQHFAVTYRGGSLSFYKNGFQLGQPVPASPGATNSDPIVLGNMSDTLNQTNLFHGALDEVGVWLRPLNETEVLTLAGRDVSGAPQIVTQPTSATRYAGGNVSFLVEATGQRPLTYAWQHAGIPLPDSNTNRLVLTNLTVADAGNYVVVLSNSLGSVASAPPAVLTVLEIADITTGMIGYWPMDETSGTVLNDASGRGHHAAVYNSQAASLIGMIGGAFDFDGIGGFAVVPHAVDLNLYDQGSMAVWISPRTFGVAGSGGIGRILRKDINYDWTIYDPIDSMRFYGLNKATYDAPANSVTTNEWQHVAAVIKDGAIQFFRNGRALAQPIPGLLGPTITNDLILGNYGPDLSINRLFNGSMDDLGLWDRALTAAEIDGIYHNGLLGKPLNAPYEPFEIRALDFPSPAQVRVLFFSPYTGRQYALERRDQLDAGSWTEETPVAFNALAGGMFEAILNRPAQAHAFYRVTLQAEPPIFVEDFETGAPGWTHGGPGDNWEVGVPVNGPGAAVSGTNVYATSLTGDINPYSECYLRSPAIDLSGRTRATLAFQEWRHVDVPVMGFDYHWTAVNVLDAGTLAVLQQVYYATGATSGWEPRSLPLPTSVLGRSVVLEFFLNCDVQVTGFEGWYLDDVTILPQ